MDLDLIIRNGTVVDGTGADRRRADIGVKDGRITEIGDLGDARATRTVDADGLVVAPGVIDLHTHYDGQVHWDPHLTNTGTHGATTVAVGNCGFGFAPCKPEMRDRYMQMMERTEQIPYEALRQGMPWKWETFPEWMEHLRSLPKALNMASFLPINPLMIYVMGIEAAKSRPATEDERAEMRRLLHEAMDAGALGFAVTWLGEMNNHTDFDGSPMPSDIMEIEEAYNLAQVLRERGGGIIQANTDIPMLRNRRDVCAELAHISGATVIHNVIMVVPDSTVHLDVLAWLDECTEEGLDIYTQSIASRGWTEFTVLNYTSWDVLPVFKAFTDQDPDGKAALARSPEYRQRVVDEYDFGPQQHAGTRFHEFTMIDAAGAAEFTAHENKTVAEIAADTGRSVTDTFYDILVASKLQAQFTHLTRFVYDEKLVGPVLQHPRVLAGGSDGGAHVKFVAGGQWPTDLIIWLARDSDQFTLEEIHAKISALPARVLGLPDRGTLVPGNAADIMIYDLDELGYQHGRYEVRHDLPGGDWRKFVDVRGLRYVLVNGEITFVDGVPQDPRPGALVTTAVGATT
ncbi:amidohydrolase family protein [Pseudonocardia xishanensis]|uniref:Amidohydrolase family protein n=1 Tax=Pseudonocardia xishanensis TaxID=630995 RepID=A0ABP8RV98_9PSEU